MFSDCNSHLLVWQYELQQCQLGVQQLPSVAVQAHKAGASTMTNCDAKIQ